MTDSLNPSRRSENMRRIKAKNTKPEMVVRKVLHSLGYRYRLYAKELPGKPDIVFRSRKKAIFVHGCFWHQHGGCREGRLPRSRQEYWVPKLRGNTDRDQKHRQALEGEGWQLLVIWECETTMYEELAITLEEFLR